MNITQRILKDLKVDLTEHFDNNFSRGGFFGNKWAKRKDGTATHLNNTGRLRNSIRSRIVGNSIVFTSSTPYAAIHNEGSHETIQVQGYKRKRKKEGYTTVGAHKRHLNMPKRQFIGEYPGMNKTVERAARRAIEAAIKQSIKK